MTDEHLQLLNSWHQEPTTTRAIGDALADLWRNTNTAEARGPNGRQAGSDAPQQVLVRTSVLNFVIYASSYGVAERASSVMAHLSTTHPSRSIAIVAQPEDPTPSLGASLNARCHADAEGRPRFCFEQIDLTARGSVIEHLPGVVTQLLIHDLPTLLWWPGEPPIGEPLFDAMAGVCDRLIVDSSDFGDPEVMLAALADFAAGQSGCASLSDLNWDRLVDWREMLAQFFDVATAQPYLRRIRNVAIEYAVDPGGQRNSAQALLLAGWLAALLGWNLAGVARTHVGGSTIRMNGDNGSVQIAITSADVRQGQPGSLTAVHLSAGEGDELAAFTVRASGDAEHGTTIVELPGTQPVSRTVRLEPASESALIGEEMEAFGRERAYDDALQAAGLLARSLLAGPAVSG